MSWPADAWFRDTLSALAYSLARTGAELKSAALQPPYNDVTEFLLQQHAQMPDYLRPAMRAATLGFDCLGWLGHGTPFHRQAPDLRQRQIHSWKNSRFGSRRDLMRYYESLALLALYSRPGGILDAHREERAGISVGADVGDGTAEAGWANEPELSARVVTHPEPELHYPIVVVGSGPGGAITACLLAEAGRTVLLIEEGPFYALESCVPFSREEMLQKYRNGGQTVALGRNKIAYVEGRCVGGGSEINSGLYHRTPPEILEAWRKDFAVESLTPDDLAPHFAACEQELTVSLLPGPAPAASLKLHEGAGRLGWHSLEVPRWFRYSDGDPDGAARQSMTKTFVPRFLKAGGRLLPATRVQRIRAETQKWLLEAEHGSAGVLRIQAECLFICGGAIQTPALLRRSGITRNIGNSLRLHPTVKVAALFGEPINDSDMGVPVHQVKEFAPRLTLGCSISTPPYLALGMLNHRQELSRLPETWRQMANYYAAIAGEGRGAVRSLAGFRDPLVRYSLTPGDRRALADGLRKLCEALFAAGATAMYPSLGGGPELLHRDQLAKLPQILPDRVADLLTIHLFSSCPMGEDKSKCGADSFGRVHGFRNLWIADASLLCTAPGVNPQGSVMAIARRNALHFLETAK